MGIEFRSGNYVRRVRLGKRTVKEGEAAAIWNINGVHREVVGPKRESLFFSTIRFLDRFTATHHQYLIIRHKNGLEEHIKGPRTMYCNPVKHEWIRVEDAVHLTSKNEAIVIYKEHNEESKEDGPPVSATKEVSNAPGKPSIVTAGAEDSATVERRILYGPAVFIPLVDEKVHQFTWSGHPQGRGRGRGGGGSSGGGDRDGDDDTPAGADGPRASSVAKGANAFSVLRTRPQSWQVEVALEAADHSRCAVQLTLTLELADPEALMDAGAPDPIGDLWAALCADMAAAGTRLQSCEPTEVSAALGDLAALPSACGLAGRLGFVLGGVAVRGVRAGRALAAARAAAAEGGARRARAAAEAAQARELAAAEVAAQRARAAAEHELEALRAAHAGALRGKAEEADRRERRARDADVLGFLRGLREVGVDLTAVLTAQGGGGSGGGGGGGGGGGSGPLLGGAVRARVGEAPSLGAAVGAAGEGEGRKKGGGGLFGF